MIAGSVISTGGLATFALKKFVVKNAENHNSATTSSKENRNG
jgi:hypothetical protein